METKTFYSSLQIPEQINVHFLLSITKQLLRYHEITILLNVRIICYISNVCGKIISVTVSESEIEPPHLELIFQSLSG